jgi:hypothetical protein
MAKNKNQFCIPPAEGLQVADGPSQGVKTVAKDQVDSRPN